METINVYKDKLGHVFEDVEKLISDFEELVPDQDKVVKERLKNIKEREVEGKTEKELDDYLKKGGVKIE